MLLISSFSRCHLAFIVEACSFSSATSRSTSSLRFLDALSFSLDSACRSISSATTLRWSVSIGVGSESISIFRREAASSIRSIALSGRKRPVM